jgi:restriction system protein
LTGQKKGVSISEKNKIIGAQIIKYFQPVIDSLKELGGSGQPSEVKEVIAEKLQIPDDEQAEQISSGASRFSKNVDWARFYLAKANYIDSSTRGVWSLTESGRNLKLSNANALKLFQEIHQTFSVERRKQRDKSSRSDTTDVSDEIPDEETDHRSILLKKIMNLFEMEFHQLSL